MQSYPSKEEIEKEYKDEVQYIKDTYKYPYDPFEIINSLKSLYSLQEHEIEAIEIINKWVEEEIAKWID